MLSDAEHGAQDDIAEVDIRHAPGLFASGTRWCEQCDRPWPCLPRRLADRAERAERAGSYDNLVTMLAAAERTVAEQTHAINQWWARVQETERERDEAQAKTRAVEAAWTVAGARPGWHRMWKSKLRSEWPVLAYALDRLV